MSNRLKIPTGNRLSVATANRVAPYGIWTPALLDKGLWLDASDASTITQSGGYASQWRDKSGRANHVAQATGSLQPAYASNTLSFVNGDFLNKSAGVGLLASDGECSLFVVHTIINPSTSTNLYPELFRNNSNAVAPSNRRPLFGYIKAAPTFRISNANNDGCDIADITSHLQRTIISYTCASDGSCNMYIDGVFEDSFSTTINTSTTHSLLSIGDLVNQNLTMMLNEIILITDAVSTVNRQKIEGYLAWKWSLTAGLDSGHPYKSAPPLV